VIATNWNTGQAEVFSKDKTTDADTVSILLASAAIPGFFPTRRMDGGLVMNTPLQPVIDDGADEIRIVYLDPDISKMPPLTFQSTFDTLDRAPAINQAFHINADIEKARQVNRAIEPFDESAREHFRSKKSDLAVLADMWKRVRSARPPRKLTIHRYHPRHDLGGLLGLLRFEKSAIKDLIRNGYQDTMEHDCGANDCVRSGKRAEAAG